MDTSTSTSTRGREGGDREGELAAGAAGRVGIGEVNLSGRDSRYVALMDDSRGGRLVYELMKHWDKRLGRKVHAWSWDSGRLEGVLTGFQD